MQPLSLMLDDEKGEELDIDAFFLPGGILDPNDYESESVLPLPRFQDCLSPSKPESMMLPNGREPLYNYNEERLPVELHDHHLISTETLNSGVVADTQPPPGFSEPPPGLVDAKFSLPKSSTLLAKLGGVEVANDRLLHPSSNNTLLGASLHSCPNENNVVDEPPMNVVTFQADWNSSSIAPSPITPTAASPDTLLQEPDALSSPTAYGDDATKLNPNATIFTPVHIRTDAHKDVVEDKESSVADLNDESSKCDRSNTASLHNDDDNSVEPAGMNEAIQETITTRYQYHERILHLPRILFNTFFLGPYHYFQNVIMIRLYPSLLYFSSKTVQHSRVFLRAFIRVAFLTFAIISTVLSQALHSCFSTNIISRPFSVPIYTPSKTAYIYMVFLLTPSICDLMMRCITLPHFFPHLLSSLALFSCVGPEHQDKTKVPGRLSFLILSKLRWAFVCILYYEGFGKLYVSPMLYDRATRVALAFCLAVLHNSLVLSPLTWVILSLHHLSTYLFGSSIAMSFVLVLGSLASLNALNSLSAGKR